MAKRLEDQNMIYYRVALHLRQSDTWQWKSTALTSLNALFGFLRLYHMVPKDRLRVFYSSSVEYLDLMLDRENKGLASNSIRAEKFLKGEKGINSQEMARLESELAAAQSEKIVATSVSATKSLNERHMNSPYGKSSSSVDIKRLELEIGSSGDHDLPYEFTLPSSMPQALAWAKLLVKVYMGELEP
jgi:hypothetical protein